jgi:hypothetical protein
MPKLKNQIRRQDKVFKELKNPYLKAKFREKKEAYRVGIS